MLWESSFIRWAMPPVRLSYGAIAIPYLIDRNYRQNTSPDYYCQWKNYFTIKLLPFKVGALEVGSDAKLFHAEVRQVHPFHPPVFQLLGHLPKEGRGMFSDGRQ